MKLKAYIAGILVGLVLWATWELVTRGHVMAAGAISLAITNINILLMRE